MVQQKSPRVIDMPFPVDTPEVPATDQLDYAIFIGLLVLLMFGPLAFGATQAWSQFIQRTFALVLGGMWLVRCYRRGMIDLSNNPLLVPAAFFFGFAVLQLVASLTAYRYATMSEALNLIPCGIVLLLAGELLSSRRRLYQFVLAMAIFGFAVSLFALLQDSSNTDKIYGVVPVHYLSVFIYGPYVNHNHYAGLMEMLTPLACAVGLFETGVKRNLLLFATIVMATSIVLSRSRGGVIGIAASATFVCITLYRRDREHRASLAILGVIAAVGILVALLANRSGLHRLSEMQDDYRVAIYSDSICMWLDRPLLGFGWGTFPVVYPQFRSFYTDTFINHAHNDYLETLTETGLVGAALAGWFLFAMFRGGMRKIADKSDSKGSTLSLGLLAAIVALLAHSFMDFNLHIPANAAIFYSVCAAAATPFRRTNTQHICQ